MMFDFQTLRYSSPMVDLATFLANSTGTDVRSTHFSFIFKAYHEEVIRAMMMKLKKTRKEISEIYRSVNTAKIAQFRAREIQFNFFLCESANLTVNFFSLSVSETNLIYI